MPDDPQEKAQSLSGGGPGERDLRPRIRRMKDDGDEPELPPIEAGAYIVDLLMEIGPAHEGMAGPVPITYRDLAAYEGVTGVPLDGFEARILRVLSIAWCAGINESRAHNAPPPYIAAPTEASRARVAQRLKAAFGDRKQKPAR